MSAVPVAVGRRFAWPWQRVAAAATVLGVAVLYLAFRGQYVLPHDDDAGVFRALNTVRDWVDDNRNSSPVFLFFVNQIRLGVAVLFDTLQAVLQGIGWLGVTGAVGALALVLAGWRTALLAVAGFLAFGILGLWEESIDTLALTLTAVLLSLAIGVPLGILAGRSARFRRLITPVLDVMQIMPTFAYLAPMALFFLIGAPAAAIATLIYAIPPAIRITALGIREVPHASVEAATSMGSTRWQLLRKVQLPMAKRTIVLAVNQTIMMALAMVVITALIDAPGLGEPIIQALERVNVGGAFDAGLAIVIMAIVLDRLTVRASQRVDTRNQEGRSSSVTRRRALVLGATAGAGLAIAAGAATPQGRDFPESWFFSFAQPVNTVVDWVETNLFAVTDAVKNALTAWLLNPMQHLLTTAPWWLVVAVVFGLGLRVSGLGPALTAAACLTAVAALGLWQHGMETLTTVLVAAAITLAVGIVLGVVAGRSSRYAAVQRPFLDAAQTMPSFVYLLPAVALFGATRFTAIVASVIYAAPPVIRLVEEGIRGVPPTVVEAATAAGSTKGQLLWKVQLPMARHALLLAANQGIIMVLAMVVVGGLVGAGALGYDVVAGFAQREDFGKGLAAGIAIVLLGVMLDRITQGAGGRSAAEQAARHTG
ncbi:MAG TPA: ABC transporter permease subunit [Actinomycetes bacterium]|nr:ABC transporter permease subunit [Actinomycetes bacterium]